MISRIVANKGINEFLNSAKILKKYPDWKFLIVGVAQIIKVLTQ